MYNAYITTIKTLRPHSNSDQGLQVATVFGNDVIVKNMNLGDLVVYFPTDGQLGKEFAEENKLTRATGGYMHDEKRNVTTIKLRGEKSDGLIVKIDALSKFTDISKLKEGDTISVLNGVVICSKYVPVRKQQSTSRATNKAKTKKPEEAVSFPMFKEHADTAQLAYNTGQFKIGDQCVITLKMHGTSQRTAYTIKEKKRTGWIARIFGAYPRKSWEYVTGTRRVTLKDFNGGFYGDNSFRRQWHDYFVGKLHKGETIYYEVVGYTDTGGLIMSECNNELTKDKEFIKQYGKTTQFTYGCEYGQSDIYAYRMTMQNEDGVVVEYSQEQLELRCEQMGVKVCPTFEKFIFTTQEDLMERANKYVDGVDPIGKTHIREGIIVRINGKDKFSAYKHKSFNFKVLESIVKVEAEFPDMEEEQSEQVEE